MQLMAGTRRQSRPRQHLPSVSQAATSVKATAIVPETKPIEVSESVDERSPHPETPESRSITAICKNCNGNVGEFFNSWHKVTSSYYTPALLGSYRSFLRKADKRIEAASKTELAGCIIDLTYCPHCDDCLGFVVVDSPADGKRFRGRDFFKLQRIDLRQTSAADNPSVKPQEDEAPDLVAFEESASLSPRPSIRVTETMNLDLPLSSSHPMWTQPAAQTGSQPQQQQPILLPPLDQSSQPRGTVPSITQSGSSIERNLPHPSTVPATELKSVGPTLTQPTFESTITNSVKNAPLNSSVNGQYNGYGYPRQPQDVQLDAFERLQTQISQNTSALQAQDRNQTDYSEILRQLESSLRRDFQAQIDHHAHGLRRLDESVLELRQELQNCRQDIAGLAHEVRVNSEISARGASGVQNLNDQDAALELMTRQIGDISHRTADIENLRLHVEVMKAKINRLELSNLSLAAVPNPHPLPGLPAHQPAPPTQLTHAAPPQPAQGSHFQMPARPIGPPHGAPVVADPEIPQRHEPASTQFGWAAVNAGVKRVYSNGTDSPYQDGSPAPGSPKRLRLATTEPQSAHHGSQVPLGQSNTLPSQPQPMVATQPQSSHVHPPYSTQDGPSDESWQPESQRQGESRPARGRGSRGGRGPGSRGGRGRKSLQGHEHHADVPAWEREGWQGVSDSQASPDGFEGHTNHPARSIIRRGGGGSGMRGGYSPIERSNEWAPHIGPRSTNLESPNETKKSRSKPVRNAEGILIRKDGRPDMRSQSSAANLRKVHARKEEGQKREGETGVGSIHLRQSISTAPETPSPTPLPHVTDSVQKKHNAILGRMFPDGLDDSRKQHDYAHQVFDEDCDHTAHPRGGHTSSKATRTPRQIKKEHVERSEVAETQAPANEDVEMEDTPAESHTPSGEPPSAVRRQALTAHQEGGNSVQIPETQATEGSATLAKEVGAL